jgi:hypothetical protein
MNFSNRDLITLRIFKYYFTDNMTYKEFPSARGLAQELIDPS